MDYFQTKCLTANDLNNFLIEYYDECGWDKATGIPKREKLEELGLIKALEGQ
jgi:aldehyde:ferredoxin oxidoreductase